jgi:hypothetical protein
MLKTRLEELHNSFHEAVIFILKKNNENLTENNTGFFFDFQKLSENSVLELTYMLDKIQINNTNSQSLTITNYSKLDEELKSTTMNENTSTLITVNQKFIVEYNNDVQKAADKNTSILKFISAKKKYLRNSESLMIKNEFDLKKEHYLLN